MIGKYTAKDVADQLTGEELMEVIAHYLMRRTVIEFVDPAAPFNAQGMSDMTIRAKIVEAAYSSFQDLGDVLVAGRPLNAIKRAANDISLDSIHNVEVTSATN